MRKEDIKICSADIDRMGGFYRLSVAKISQLMVGVYFLGHFVANISQFTVQRDERPSWICEFATLISTLMTKPILP